jgi:hypothetical protein
MPATAFRVVVLADAFAAPVAGHARVRLVQASYSLPQVAIDLGEDGSLDVAAVDRFADTGADGLDVAAGADVALGVVGADAAHAKLGGFVLPAALVGEGAEVVAVVTGLNNVRPRDPRGLVVVLVPRNGDPVTVRQNPTVFLLAASPDAGGLDGYAFGGKVFDNVAFGKLVSRRVPPTTSGHGLAVRATGARAGSPPLATFDTGPLAAGEQYLLVVGGLVDGLSLHVYQDELPLALDGNGRVRVIHAAVGVGAIDVGRYSAGGMPTWNDVADFAGIAPGAGSAAAGTAIVDGSVALPVNPGVRPAGDTVSTPLRFASGSLMNTDRFIGVFAGAWTPTGAQKPPRFIVVKTAANAWTAAVLNPL